MNIYDTKNKLIYIDLINKLIIEIKNGMTKNFSDRDDLANCSKILSNKIDRTIRRIFSENTHDFDKYIVCSEITSNLSSFGMYESELDKFTRAKKIFVSSVVRSLSILSELIEKIEEDSSFYLISSSLEKKTIDFSISNADSNDIFIVHGHDILFKSELSSFCRMVGLNPIILHDQPNGGKTIIEKFEKNSDVGYAIILLTPDDEGKSVGGELSRRARQNVLFEMGYFLGKLGRNRICAIKKGVIEMPSDLHGVLPIDFDVAGGWKLALCRELRQAGYHIDANKIFE